jgi:hypothetical protein
VCHEASLEPSSSVRDAYYGPVFFTCTHFEAPGINVTLFAMVASVDTGAPPQELDPAARTACVARDTGRD